MLNNVLKDVFIILCLFLYASVCVCVCVYNMCAGACGGHWRLCMWGWEQDSSTLEVQQVLLNTEPSLQSFLVIFGTEEIQP